MELREEHFMSYKYYISIKRFSSYRRKTVFSPMNLEKEHGMVLFSGPYLLDLVERNKNVYLYFFPRTRSLGVINF